MSARWMVCIRGRCYGYANLYEMWDNVWVVDVGSKKMASAGEGKK